VVGAHCMCTYHPQVTGILQVVEFVEFKERLDMAFGKASAVAESAFLCLRVAFQKGLPEARACLQDIAKVGRGGARPPPAPPSQTQHSAAHTVPVFEGGLHN
jgi:hypothetical protein